MAQDVASSVTTSSQSASEGSSAGAPGQFSQLYRDVQQRLRDSGFDPGPATGEFDSRTQAALAQFQLSRLLPASGMPDERTLEELGVQRRGEALDERPAARAP